MAQKTDLNVAPYYDDFDVNDNFHRVLFRPGFAVQARELTQLQSILQNQIERHGQNVFKEGTVIIPGQISISNNYTSIQLASQFGGEDVVVSQYLNTTTPVTITGATSGATGTPQSTGSETVTLANNNTTVFTSGYSNPELAPDSGDIVYIENRKPIQRASDQTEDIKLIIEF